MKVSILTLLQYSRKGTLDIIFENIREQTRQPDELVIVEGSQSLNDGTLNQTYVKETIAKHTSRGDIHYNIKYIPYSGHKLGGLRNLGNSECTGDIIIAWDDDDYNFKTRIEHTVEKLSSSKCLIAGSSRILIYDYILEKLFLTDMRAGFGLNHSTNNVMAYKKEYLFNHAYDYSKTFSEELLFTNSFTEEMVELDTLHTGILNSHDHNTYNKRAILSSALLNPSSMYTPLSDDIALHIPPFFLEEYKRVLLLPPKPAADVTYFCGGASIVWDPKDKSLGGSEQAVVELSEAWVRMGKSVDVYGNFNEHFFIHNGVSYYHWTRFPYNTQFNTLVAWRSSGLQLIAPPPFKVNAKCIILDLHDNFTLDPGSVVLIQNAEQAGIITKYAVKSRYHQFLLENTLKLPEDRILLCKNGIRVKSITDAKAASNFTREPHRFVYASCYTRGLQNVITKVWPTIFAAFPDAELHVYYGMDLIRDENLKNTFRLLLGTPGVIDHGRRPHTEIIREKLRSTYHLYLSDSPAEIDCISVRESIVAGCLPIITKGAVFGERLGWSFDVNSSSSDNMWVQVGKFIVDKLNNTEFVLNLAKMLENVAPEEDWDKVAATWEDVF